MRTILFGKDGRIRVGWRALTFLFAFLLLASILIFAATIVLSQIPFGETATGYLPLIFPFTISALVAILLGWGFGKLFEHLPFRAIGIAFTPGWLKNAAVGCLIGAIAMGSAVLIAVMGGGMSLTVNRESPTSAITGTLWTTLLIFAVGALSEETLFRGYILQTFVRSRLVWMGTALTAVLFAFAHNSNPSANWISMLNTLLAGVWFAIAYLKTRDLWFPLGMHLMWNWLQGPVFGINVSGISDFSPDPILRATDSGPAFLTGGSYGIEGGIACTIALVISIGLLCFLPGLKPGDDMLALSEPPELTRSGS